MKVIKRKNSTNTYLKEGVEYTVYAMYFGAKSIELMLDIMPSGPSPVKIDDLDIVDNRISKYWIFSGEILSTENHSSRPPMLSFPEWIDNSFFLDGVLDGGPEADIWRKKKSLIEAEYASDNLKDSAIYVKENWVMCISCSNAWEIESTSEVITCPSCMHKQKRPANLL